MKSIAKQELIQLVEAARSGSEKDLAALIKATEKDLYRFLVFLVRNQALAQDFAQETYIKMIENLAQLKDAASFQSWLFRMAKNLYLDYVRSPKSSAHEDIESLVDLAAEGDQAAAVQEIEALLTPLDPEDRFGVLLVYLHGYSYQEAAEIMEIGPDALRSRLHRARELLAKKRK